MAPAPSLATHPAIPITIHHSAAIEDSQALEKTAPKAAAADFFVVMHRLATVFLPTAC